MRVRIWAFIILALLLAVTTGCTNGRSNRGPAITPVPTKTLRPTFTHTPAKPTLTPTPAPPTATATSEAPTATSEPPTPEATLTPTPAPAAFTVTSATLNVRSGPGTNYGAIGQVRQGQSFPITGKNGAGDWWEFDYNGRAGWVSGSLVRTTGAESVQVAANIPAAPTAAPRPIARPTTRPAPTQAPAPAPATFQYVAVKAAPYPNTNDLLTVRCRSTENFSSGVGPAGILLITGPASAPPQPFGTALVFANTGMGDAMQYIYNDNCKVEIRPFIAGTYTGILVDGSGKQISEPITFTPGGNTREFMLIWRPR